MRKKTVTIEDLARMVAGGFGETKEEIGGLREEIGNLGEWAKLRFDNIDRDLEGLLAIGNKKR